MALSAKICAFGAKIWEGGHSWVDETESDVGADRPVHDISTHTTHGYGKRWPLASEKGNRAADWACCIL